MLIRNDLDVCFFLQGLIIWSVNYYISLITCINAMTIVYYTVNNGVPGFRVHLEEDTKEYQVCQYIEEDSDCENYKRREEITGISGACRFDCVIGSDYASVWIGDCIQPALQMHKTTRTAILIQENDARDTYMLITDKIQRFTYEGHIVKFYSVFGEPFAFTDVFMMMFRDQTIIYVKIQDTLAQYVLSHQKDPYSVLWHPCGKRENELAWEYMPYIEQGLLACNQNSDQCVVHTSALAFFQKMDLVLDGTC